MLAKHTLLHPLALSLSLSSLLGALLLVYRLTLPLIYNNCHACAINKKFVINRAEADAGVAVSAAAAAAALWLINWPAKGQMAFSFLTPTLGRRQAPSPSASTSLIACQRLVSKTRPVAIKNMICWLQGRTCCNVSRRMRCCCHMRRH